MGRAANELGYLPRALLIRQLSRIACNIPHYSYSLSVHVKFIQFSLHEAAKYRLTFMQLKKPVLKVAT